MNNLSTFKFKLIVGLYMKCFLRMNMRKRAILQQQERTAV